MIAKRFPYCVVLAWASNEICLSCEHFRINRTWDFPIRIMGRRESFQTSRPNREYIAELLERAKEKDY